ncbi:hypothetical protein Fleli_3857 [Bernardetia litoralis DSM 6794]|uniref:DUF4905 domain-containing protein n=1 Tax=Bernardetia litoralis (strain ATCC 23117 / DSM 6794 / NBRC 15988 / NCIMB 1366 / Fx l1 / Sio-4) TaxID=880071 RepID=I4AQC7_BERLS|nr:hypothetical protein [Bernardetia litoralis]AFM06162.1 hypothetical protein Fleli_3857 [Bernardetia litoralis DSM 6794]
MKNSNLFSYKPKNPNQKIWQVYPDPKSEFVVLEIREAKKSDLIILDSQKKEVFAIAEMEATQTLVNFFDKIILLSEIDFQNEMPLAKGLQALNMDFETIWELEEVIYYGVIEENQSKIAFTLQSNYYSVPLKINQNKEQEIEAKEENYSYLKDKVKQYFYFTNEYLTNHINYIDISEFIFEKTAHKVENSIFYAENEDYLICNYVVKNGGFENYLLCTDKKGSFKNHFLIKKLEKEGEKIPQELILMENKILWIDKNEFHFLLI